MNIQCNSEVCASLLICGFFFFVIYKSFDVFPHKNYCVRNISTKCKAVRFSVCDDDASILGNRSKRRTDDHL
jgi:hypothetical protein